MRFGFNTSDPITQALLQYAENDENLLKQALYLAFEDAQTAHEDTVRVQNIIEHITDLLTEKHEPKKRHAF